MKNKMNTHLKTVLIGSITAIVSIFLLSGCNTVEGFGKDMQHGGQKVQKAAVEEK